MVLTPAFPSLKCSLLTLFLLWRVFSRVHLQSIKHINRLEIQGNQSNTAQFCWSKGLVIMRDGELEKRGPHLDLIVLMCSVQSPMDHSTLLQFNDQECIFLTLGWLYLVNMYLWDIIPRNYIYSIKIRLIRVTHFYSAFSRTQSQNSFIFLCKIYCGDLKE